MVGGGIMGASAAWHLAHAGAAVTLVESAPQSRTTATSCSFGWVGSSASTPSSNPAAFAERLQALEAFAAIERQLGPLPIAARGALLWGANEEETAAMIAEHRAAGTRMEGLAGSQIADKEPRLAQRPPLAAWAPDDFAVEPALLARQLRAGALDLGACVRHGTADAVEVAGNRVAAVIVDGQKLVADTVVLANGFGVGALALTAGVDLPIGQSPAVLLRWDMQAHGLRHLLCADEVELRPALAGGLVSAADYPRAGEAGFTRACRPHGPPSGTAVGAREGTTSAVRRRCPAPDDVRRPAAVRLCGGDRRAVCIGGASLRDPDTVLGPPLRAIGSGDWRRTVAVGRTRPVARGPGRPVAAALPNPRTTAVFRPGFCGQSLRYFTK